MLGFPQLRPISLGVITTVVLSGAALASPIVQPCRPSVVCAVEVEDLPVVLRSSGDYQLIVPGQPATPLPSRGVAHVALVGPTIVRLDGAAYHGEIEIDPADCGGDVVHTIVAAFKPARLEFHAGAIEAKELVISCVVGCPYQARPGDDFPELPFPRDQTELSVELEFKALGYRSHTAEFRLNPGSNPIRVSLQPIE